MQRVREAVVQGKKTNQKALQVVRVDSTLNSEEAGKDMNWSDLTWRIAGTRDTRTEDQILYRSQVFLTVGGFQLVITDV